LQLNIVYENIIEIKKGIKTKEGAFLDTFFFIGQDTLKGNQIVIPNRR